MNKSQLSARVAEAASMSRAGADAAVGAVFAAVADALAARERDAIAGFGTFSTRQCAPRTGRNLRTGESIAIAASRPPRSRPARHCAMPLTGSGRNGDNPDRSRRDRIIWGGEELGGFRRSVERASIRTTTRRHRMPSVRPLPNLGRLELAPTTAVRPRAQGKYSNRFRAAYGHLRSGAGAPRCSSSTMSLAPHTDRSQDVELPLIITYLVRPRRSHRQTNPSYSIDSSPKPNCAGPRNERRQEEQPQPRRTVSRAKMFSLAGRRAEVVDARNDCDHLVPRHGFAPMPSGRSEIASASLTVGRPQKPQLPEQLAIPSPGTPSRAANSRMAGSRDSLIALLAVTIGLPPKPSATSGTSPGDCTNLTAWPAQENTSIAVGAPSHSPGRAPVQTDADVDTRRYAALVRCCLCILTLRVRMTRGTHPAAAKLLNSRFRPPSHHRHLLVALFGAGQTRADPKLSSHGQPPSPNDRGRQSHLHSLLSVISQSRLRSADSSHNTVEIWSQSACSVGYLLTTYAFSPESIETFERPHTSNRYEVVP